MALNLRCIDHCHRCLRAIPGHVVGRSLHGQGRFRLRHLRICFSPQPGGSWSAAAIPPSRKRCTQHRQEVHLIHRRDKLRSEKILQDKLFDKAENGNVRLHWNTTLDSAGRRQRRHRRTPEEHHRRQHQRTVAGRRVHRHRPQAEHRPVPGPTGNARGYLRIHGGSEGNATQTSIEGVLPPATWPTTSTARPSLPPAPAAWPRWMPKNTSTTIDRTREARPLPRHADLAFPHRLRLFRPSTRPCRSPTAARGRRRPQPATPGRSLSPRLLPLVPGWPADLWWSPDPRTVLFPDELHVSRSLAKCLRQQRFEVTFNRDFRAVIQACAAPRDYADGTWITTPMQLAYQEPAPARHRPPWKSGRSDNWSAASTARPWAGCSSANRCSAAPTTLPRSASSRWSAICATPASSSSTARCRPATCTAWAPAPSAGEFADYLQRYRDQPPTGDRIFRRVSVPGINLLMGPCWSSP